MESHGHTLREFTVHAPQLWEAPTEDELLEEGMLEDENIAWSPERRGYVTANIHNAQPEWWTYVVFAASVPMAYHFARHKVMAASKDTPGIRRVFNLLLGQVITAPYF